MLTPRTFSLAAAVLLASASSALSQTKVELSWGSEIFEQKMILSDGTVLDPSELIIEIGSFDNSFNPDWTNMDEWLTQWRVFDAITDTNPATGTTDSDPNDAFTNESGGTESARFAGEAHLLADGTSNSEDATPGYTFSEGEQAYIFIRTSDDFVEGSEWLLLTSTNDSQHVGDAVWQFPDVKGGQPQFSESWFLDDADRAVFGAIHGGDGGGGDTGGGGYTDGSTDFLLRLHTIPEPSTGLLAMLSAFLLFIRRRHS